MGAGVVVTKAVGAGVGSVVPPNENPAVVVVAAAGVVAVVPNEPLFSGGGAKEKPGAGVSFSAAPKENPVDAAPPTGSLGGGFRSNTGGWDGVLMEAEENPGVAAKFGAAAAPKEKAEDGLVLSANVGNEKAGLLSSDLATSAAVAAADPPNAKEAGFSSALGAPPPNENEGGGSCVLGGSAAPNEKVGLSSVLAPPPKEKAGVSFAGAAAAAAPNEKEEVLAEVPAFVAAFAPPNEKPPPTDGGAAAFVVVGAAAEPKEKDESVGLGAPPPKVNEDAMMCVYKNTIRVLSRKHNAPTATIRMQKIK